MNARTIATKILVSLTLLAALSSLEGCVVYGRPGPARSYHRWYR